MSLPAAPAGGPVLRDIHLPPAPPWWPPAPGWWMLAGLLLALAVLGGWLWRRRARTAQRRRRWLAELDRVSARNGDAGAALAGIHQLLRRVARLHAPAATQQRGAAWHATLARVRVEAPVIARLAALDQAMYRPATVADVDSAQRAARTWLYTAASPRGWRRAGKGAGHV